MKFFNLLTLLLIIIGGLNWGTVGIADYDIVANLFVAPTPEGAKATSTLLTIQNKTTKYGDPIHWEGGYEDTLVKTADGWRFKSRTYYESKSGDPVQPPPALLGPPVPMSGKLAAGP